MNNVMPQQKRVELQTQEDPPASGSFACRAFGGTFSDALLIGECGMSVYENLARAEITAQEDSGMEADAKKAIKETNDAVKRMADSFSSLASSLAETLKTLPASSAPAHKPHASFKSLAAWIPAILAVLGAAWWIQQYTIGSEINKAFSQRDLAFKGLQDDMQYLRKDVDGLQKQILKTSLSGAAGNAANVRAQLDTAGTIIKQLRDEKASLTPDELSSTSHQIQEVAQTNQDLPELWSTLGNTRATNLKS